MDSNDDRENPPVKQVPAAASIHDSESFERTANPW